MYPLPLVRNCSLIYSIKLTYRSNSVSFDMPPFPSDVYVLYGCPLTVRTLAPVYSNPPAALTNVAVLWSVMQRNARAQSGERDRASEARLTRYSFTFRYWARTACDLDSLRFGGQTHATFNVRPPIHRRPTELCHNLLIDGIDAPDQDRDSRFCFL